MILGISLFWPTFVVVMVVGGIGIWMNNRRLRHAPTQRRGVMPGSQPDLIVTNMVTSPGNQTLQAWHVTTDPQAYARAFVPERQE
jgi:hypothetical protein